MTVEKIIKTTELKELDITGATLLSIDEAGKLPEDMRRANDIHWWLRSPSYYDYKAAFVDGERGDVSVDGTFVLESFGVRPALEISDLKSSDLQIGDQFNYGGRSFTVISDQYALCDEIIERYPFRKNWKAKDANVYEASDIKKFVDDWFEKSKERPFQETLLKLDAFQETLLKLGAHDALTIETEYFSYRFEKSADSDYIVDVDVFDKNGACVGGTGDLHLEDYSFSEDTLDEEFVEGKGWAENLIDDDFEHMPFEDFIEGRAQEERE